MISPPVPDGKKKRGIQTRKQTYSTTRQGNAEVTVSMQGVPEIEKQNGHPDSMQVMAAGKKRVPTGDFCKKKLPLSVKTMQGIT
ncbi:MAG: hypothetical protein LKE40_14880 [Spirochaetia bacterium]|jgi:hypothetical protein|nr:hypothetical protein [Spirochaetia bacterium]